MAEDRGMRATNCRVLTKNELNYINNKYSFYIDGDSIVTKCKNTTRVTCRPKNEKFSINIRCLRKITYSKLAIEMFERFQNNGVNEFTLTDIQNAINFCYLTYQKIDDAQITKILTRE